VSLFIFLVLGFFESGPSEVWRRPNLERDPFIARCFTLYELAFE
jgi:hypothetical protein